MLLIPAIDLKNGACVRLRQGEMADATVFSNDPRAMARHWVEQGARRLHLVDLDAAFVGKPQNQDLIQQIVAELGGDIPVQLGGGIRDLSTLERYLGMGIRYMIIGTAAVNNSAFLQQACVAFPGHIIVGLDAREGKVATDGWAKTTAHKVLDLGRKFEDFGVEAIIYTDIGRDGMLSGVNIEATAELARGLHIPVIASGGLASLEDIEALCAIEATGVSAAITGRAIYEGTLDFAAAQALADHNSGLVAAARL